MKKPGWVSQIKFICFDVDGTLYRRVPEVWAAIREIIASRVARDKDWSLAKAGNYLTERYKQLGSTTKVLNELGINGKEAFNEAFSQVNLGDYLEPDQRLKELIGGLRARYRLGILSHNGLPAIENKIEAIGLPMEWFDPVVSGYDLNLLKPDPAPFLWTLEKAGMGPEESVFVGDREETDILGAKGVGMRTIMVWGKSQSADISIPRIYDLDKIFARKRS